MEELSYKTNCPQCQQKLEVDSSLWGTQVECPVCQNMFVVPFPEKMQPRCDFVEGEQVKQVVNSETRSTVQKIVFGGILAVCVLVYFFFRVLPVFQTKDNTPIHSEVEHLEPPAPSEEHTPEQLYLKGMSLWKEGKKEDGNRFVYQAAKEGHVEAQLAIGLLLLASSEGENNDNEVLREGIGWVHKSAEQNNPTAQHLLGFCYERGKGIEKNNEEALKWYSKAADQGNSAAIKALSSLKSRLVKPAIADTLDRFLLVGEHYGAPQKGSGYSYDNYGLVKVLQVSGGGVLVYIPQAPQNIVFIETTHAYVDGAVLKRGLYVYKGVFQYQTVQGGRKTVHSFVEFQE